MIDPRRVAAALVAPWPVWTVSASEESALMDALEPFGPLPQTDLFIPWNEGDPWEARVLHPPLHRAAELLGSGLLEVGEAPGRTEWRDRGRLLEETLSVGTIEASMLSDAEAGGLLTPELMELGPDPLHDAFKSAMTVDDCRAVRIVHPTTGRPGIHFEVAVPDRDPEAERRAVLEGVDRVHDQSDPPLAPDVTWWFELQRIHVVAWFTAPPLRPLPGVPTEASLPSLRGWTGDREVRAHLTDDHDAAVLQLSEELGRDGWIGGRPRWMGDRFLATWTHPTADTVPDTDVPLQLVPGCPPGLEADWVGVDPEVWSAGPRCLVRLHCALRDRDLLPTLTPRDGDAIDAEVAERLASLARIDPVHAGFPAVRLRFPLMDGSAWSAVVMALGHLPVAAIGPVGLVRMGPTFTVLLVRTDLPHEVPTWSVL